MAERLLFQKGVGADQNCNNSKCWLGRRRVTGKKAAFFTTRRREPLSRPRLFYVSLLTADFAAMITG